MTSDETGPATVGPQHSSVMRVRDQGELVALVPVLIGFHPTESLVLVATGGRSGRRLGLTVRVDLPAPEHVAAVAETAVRSILLDAPVGAAVIILADRCGTGPPHSGLADLVVHGLEGHGVDVHTVLWAASTAAGAAWACYDPCGCTGVLPDCSATPLAAAAVVGGQMVHSERADLVRMIAPADAARIRRREALLIRAVDEVLAGSPHGGLGAAFGGTAVPGTAPRGAVLGRGSPDGTSPDGTSPDGPLLDGTVVDGTVLDGIALIDRAIADAGAGRLILNDARVVALAGALADPGVRDAAMVRCAGPEAPAAEHLWTALVRETPDPEAAEPAALLAVSALLRGDGALANVALDRAERAWPGHRLTGILRAVADAGTRPEKMRMCLRHGADAALDATARSRRRRR